MGKFFRARIGGCNIGRDPSNHLFRTVLGVHYEFLPRVYSTELVKRDITIYDAIFAVYAHVRYGPRGPHAPNTEHPYPPHHRNMVLLTF